MIKTEIQMSMIACVHIWTKTFELLFVCIFPTKLYFHRVSLFEIWLYAGHSCWTDVFFLVSLARAAQILFPGWIKIICNQLLGSLNIWSWGFREKDFWPGVSGKGFFAPGNGKGNWKSHSRFTGREREFANCYGKGREGKFEACNPGNPGKSRESYKKQD